MVLQIVAWNFSFTILNNTTNYMNVFTKKMGLMVILVAGIFIGVVKGQEARQKWVNKKRNRSAVTAEASNQQAWVVLDEIEMDTYHR